MVLPAWFDHLEERFSFKEFISESFALLQETEAPAEDVYETPAFMSHEKILIFKSKSWN